MNPEKGIIANWNKEKAFGFIVPEAGGRAIFFHINDYSHRHKRPEKNLEVQFTTTTDQKGRTCAVEVTPLKGHRNFNRELRQKFIAVILLIVFTVVLYSLYRLTLVPLELISLYAIMSFVAFLVYRKDKDAAEQGAQRTPENTLHLISLLGGWPGAAIAQSFLRHKSKKLSFRAAYWLTLIANCCFLYWLTMPKGHLWLRVAILKIYFMINQVLH